MAESDPQPPPDAIPAQDDPNGEYPEAEGDLPIIPKPSPSPQRKGVTHTSRPDQTPLWKEILEVSAFLLGLFFAYIYWGQLKAMQGQLGQMQTDAHASSQQFQVQLQHYDAGLGINQIQIGKLDSSIAQASRLATATEEANSNVVEADRPWMGMALDVTPLEVDKNPSAHMVIINSGRRPAQVDAAQLQAGFFQSGIPKNPPYPSPPTSPSKNFIVPGGSLALAMNVFQSNVDAPDLALLNGGKTVLYIYAKIVYRDVKDGSSHFTHGCWRYAPKTVVGDAGFVTCSSYNEAN
jgi:hypothetical protein